MESTLMCFGNSGWECSKLWLMCAIIFFLAAILKRQLEEWTGYTEFNLPIAVTAGVLGLIIFQYIINLKVGLLIGLAFMLIGGFLFGKIMENYEGSY